MDASHFDNALSGGILESMGDGVLVLRADGRVAVANAAACAILGMDAMEKDFVLARLLEFGGGNDGFLQVLLDSVYDGVTIHDRVTRFVRPDGEERSLGVTASHLRDAGGKVRGSFIVLRDMTEVESLRQSGEALNEELKKALRVADEKTRELESALLHGQRFRLWLAVGVVVLFVGLGAYHWFSGPEGRHAETVVVSDKDSGVLTVAPRLLTRSISLSGTVAPLEEVVFTAPFQGMIKRLPFHYGDHVKEGQELVVLEASSMESRVRDARTEYIKARKQMMEMVHWDKAVDVSRARRDVSQAHSQMAMAEGKAEEDRKLLDQGIIPKSEYDSSMQELRTKKMQYAASRETLRSVMDKGDAEYVEIARMELDNAEAKLKAAEEQLAGARITAPVAGVAIRPSAVTADQSKLAVGIVVNEGQPLVSVGSLAGLSIVAEVDELDINSLKKGQPVKVSGDAFPGITLKGRIDQISSQANDGQVPTFTATIRLTELPADVGDKVRLGMTASMQVETYSNPQALLVPLSAVATTGGRSVVRVKDKDGKVEERAVTTGYTTLTEVEVRTGLKPGETVLTGAPAGGGNAGSEKHP
ncbi:efflux RND transporter periplasmic adaptor subunit [Pseudodesulfovibrio sp.]|uniref:efflux RND transporter periplasmic adaptor subunit n=1 Tax=Pseudodesulfovibrio sp. TaxID=2035812 RepID=UPI002620FC54|nr:efflux RND transporter periplasmic adaptor subunit [Pseudodesulfovibrio sp.]MDD3312890.1 efflux RND transporter periplasmic adaptor subunit [Pseudodesulfovibrio sp.]